MGVGKAAALFVVFLLLAALGFVRVPVHAEYTPGAPVYYSVEPVALSPLTNLNTSINGLETPATPSPVGQYFNVEIHLSGGTSRNVPAGVDGVEVHFNFSSILAYAQVVNFTDDLGTPDGVLTGPSSSLIYAITGGLYSNSSNLVNGPPYTGATQYEVAAAATSTPEWNSIDGLVAVIGFQITAQPSAQDFYALMNITKGDVVNGLEGEVPFDIVPGTLQIDAPVVPVQQYYTLSTSVVGSGSVTQSPSNATYLNGTVVSLTAVPASGWMFQAWSGDVTGTENPATVTMDANKTVTATFTEIPVVNYTLTVNVVGGGTVTQSPSASSYSSGTVVTLTAVPASGWTFQAWGGDVTGALNPATVTMSGDETVSATFVQVSVVNYTLTVNVVGSGTVSESPSAATYSGGTVVTVTAVPAVNWTFQGWSGDLTGAQNPGTVILNANKVVTATFVQVALGEHDVAVSAVSVSSSEVPEGGTVWITVEASNLGGFAETFDVTVYYGTNFIHTVDVENLAPHSSETLTFAWMTGSVAPGVYTISASATVVPGDVNPANNYLADGTVDVTSVFSVTQLMAPFGLGPLIFLGLGVLGGSVFMIPLFASYSKKKKKT